MSEIHTIEGEIHRDERGKINSLNHFHFEDVRRCYMIHHPDMNVVRGWHGHQHERKWFYCVKGRFTLGLVKVDDWNHPSADLPVCTYRLSEQESRLICVPAGYASWLKAGEPGSIMTVFSDKTLEEAAGDSWRYDRDLWHMEA